MVGVALAGALDEFVEHPVDLGGAGYQQDDDVALARHVPRGIHRACPLRLVETAMQDHHVVTGVDDVPGHGLPHGSETDDSHGVR